MHNADAFINYYSCLFSLLACLFRIGNLFLFNRKEKKENTLYRMKINTFSNFVTIVEQNWEMVIRYTRSST